MMDIKPGTLASVLVGNKTFNGNLIIILGLLLSPVVTSLNYKGWQPGNFVKSIIEGKLEEIFLRLLLFSILVLEVEETLPSLHCHCHNACHFNLCCVSLHFTWYHYWLLCLCLSILHDILCLYSNSPCNHIHT